ncbi:MAG: inhibitor of cysteine peptidase [Candidatus Paceibacteria bacterium]|jgi:inhibitor of cysteine peptidase
MEKQSTFKLITGILFIVVVALSVYLFTSNKEPSNMIESLAPVSSMEVIILESFPVQINVLAKGEFTNGCWRLGDHTVSHEGQNFAIELAAFAPGPDQICTDNAPQFEERVSLDVYGLPQGTYTVSVNGIDGEFTLNVLNIPQEEPSVSQSEGLYEGDIIAINGSPFIDFNQADYEEALESDKTIFLYFFAKWCPTCKRELRDATEPAFDAYTGDNIVGFRVNYNDRDTSNFEDDLAAEFGVLYQHTKVFIKDGEMIFKVPNSWSEVEYLEAFKKYQ